MYSRIATASFKIPNFVSNTLKDLIHSILQADTSKRINLEAIDAHPWLEKSQVIMLFKQPMVY